MQATAKIFFLKAPAKRNKDGLIPVRLKITHANGKNKDGRKYYSIAEKLENNEWAFISEEEIKEYKKYSDVGGRSKIKDRYIEYKRICDEAEGIIKTIPTFSINQFEERFYKVKTKWDNVFEALINYIQVLRENDQHGYAASFESTLRAVKEFHEKKKYHFNVRKDKVETRTKLYLSGKHLFFIDITPTWLKRFENWMKTDGKSRTTIGIYMRNLRRIFNVVIKEHGVKAEYPFLKHKPKTGSGNKRALSPDGIAMIANYKTEHPQEIFYKDMWMFSFLGNGMNTADIARLKFSNLEGDELVFVRQKTIRKQDEQILKAPITKSMQAIINRHSKKAIGHDSYLFPILKPGMTEREIYYTIKQFTKQLNKYIKTISEKLGLGKVTSYAARHSWATISKNSGTSTEYIKEALGHSSVAVTEKYLKSFEKETRQKHSQSIEDTVYKTISA